MVNIPEWLDNAMAIQTLLWLGSFTIIVTAVAKLWRPAKRFIDGVDTLFGTGKDDSLANRLARIESGQVEHRIKIDRIHKEVLTNHGESLRDRVDSVSRQVTELSQAVRKLAELQERDYHRLRVHIEEADVAKAVIDRLVRHLDLTEGPEDG